MLWGPVLVAGIVTKGSRMAQRDVEWWKRVLGVAPDVLFAVGFGIAVGTLLWATHRTLLRPVGVVITQLVALLTFAIQMVAYGYFRATGLALDYGMFRFSLGRVEETAPIVGSQITIASGLALALVPFWIVVAPWLARVTHSPLPQTSTPGSHRQLMRAVFAMVVGIGCLSTSHRVAIAGVPNSVMRDPVGQLVVSYLDTLTPRSLADIALPPPRHTGPQKVVTTGDTKKQNVVVIVLESTRADATTPYRPKLATTPFLASMAKEATRVQRAYAIVPHTSKALVAILCGVEPRPSLDIVESSDKGMPAKCLAKLLAGVGYDSAFFQAPKGTFERRAQLVRNMGYAKFLSGDRMPREGFARVNYFGYEDAIMLGPSEAWLKTEAREPFLATYLTSASHHPYGVPPSHANQVFAKGEQNKYLNAVHYVDSVVERIVAQYKAAGLYERTIFVVVGDHGEGFNEHGLTTHDDVIYEEGLRVPLIVRAPGRDDLPREIAGPVNQLGIVPTILSLLGLRGVDGRHEAKSIYEDVGARPLYAACYRNAQCSATIRGDMKLLYFFDDKPTLLVDLKKDPGEKNNLASQHPALVREWTEDIARWTLAVEEAHKDTNRAALARVVRRTPPQRIRRPLEAAFGDLFKVLYCTAKRRHRALIAVTCVYEVMKPLDASYRLRVHGTTDTETDTFDHKPVRGLYPMRDWKPGDFITDNFDVRPTGSWEFRDVSLCLELEKDGAPSVRVNPVKPGVTTCMPFGSVEARAEPTPPTPVPTTPVPGTAPQQATSVSPTPRTPAKVARP